MTYTEPTFEAGKAFFMEYRGKGKILMMNLLKFHKIASYEEDDVDFHNSKLSGLQAYEKYMELTTPFLKNAGSKILFYGNCGAFVIGPSNEKWDAMLLVEHASAEAFVAFAQNKTYLAVIKHRKAALKDSRLLPITALQ